MMLVMVCMSLPVQAQTTPCATLGVNQACLVAGNVTLTPRTDDEPPTFASVGDIVNIGIIRELELSGDAQVLFHFQANLPVGEVLQAVAYGDVRVEFPIESAVTLTLTANTNANIRGGAGTGFATVGRLDAGTSATAVGVNSAGNWYFIQFGDDQAGWVFADLVTVAGDSASLAVLEDTATVASGGSGLAGVPVINVMPTDESEDAQGGLILISPELEGATEIIVNNTFLQVRSVVSIMVRIARAVVESVRAQAETIITELENGLPPTAELIMQMQTLRGQIRVTAFTGLVGGLAIERALSVALDNAYAAVQVREGTEAIIPLDSELTPVVQPVVIPYESTQITSIVEYFGNIWGAETIVNTPVVPATPPTIEEFEQLVTQPPALEGVYEFAYSKAFFPGLCRDDNRAPTNPNYNPGSLTGNITFDNVDGLGEVLQVEVTDGRFFRNSVGQTLTFVRTSTYRYESPQSQEPLYIEFTSDTTAILVVVYTIVFIEDGTGNRTIQCERFENNLRGTRISASP
jgi:uncharacterized protein YgiM (DUF1202 family)